MQTIHASINSDLYEVLVSRRSDLNSRIQIHEIRLFERHSAAKIVLWDELEPHVQLRIVSEIRRAYGQSS